MANAARPDRGRPSGHGPGGKGGIIEKNAVETRQGFRGLPILYVLLASLMLAVAAYFIVHFYFFGTLL